jgi:hypothetical protein
MVQFALPFIPTDRLPEESVGSVAPACDSDNCDIERAALSQLSLSHANLHLIRLLLTQGESKALG